MAAQSKESKSLGQKVDGLAVSSEMLQRRLLDFIQQQ